MLCFTFMLHTTVCPVHCPAGIAAVAEVCDNLSSAHGVLMHANLAIHELVKEEEQRLLAEEQKALTEEAEEQQKTPADEQKVPTEEQKKLTEEHTLPTGEKIEHTKRKQWLMSKRSSLRNS